MEAKGWESSYLRLEMSVFFDWLQLILPESILELKKTIMKFNSQCLLNVEFHFLLTKQVSALIEQLHSVYSAIILCEKMPFLHVGYLILEINPTSGKGIDFSEMKCHRFLS